MDRDNRASIRLPLTLSIKARFARFTQNLVTLDVSADGAFVVTPEPPSPGHLVHLSAILPSSHQQVALRGMVVRQITGVEARERKIPAGMGIKFYGLGKTNKRAWEDFFHHSLEQFMTSGSPLHPPTPQTSSSKPEALEADASGFERDEVTKPWPPAQETERALLDGASQKKDKEPTPRGGALEPVEPVLPPKPVGGVQPPRFTEQPTLYQVCPPTVEQVVKFRSDALESGGVMIAGAARKQPGSPAVVAVVHPKTKAEFHIPGQVQLTPPDRNGVPVQFINVTEQTKKDFEYFATTGGAPPTGRPSVGPTEGEMAIFETADEAQWDVVLDQIGAVLAEGVLPLESALDPFDKRR